MAEPSMPGLGGDRDGNCRDLGIQACGRPCLDGGAVRAVPTLSTPAPEGLGASTRHVVSWKTLTIHWGFLRLARDKAPGGSGSALRGWLLPPA